MEKMTETREVDVSIVIACYNDAPHLKANFKKIVDIMDLTKYSYEIVFVDDKSKDNSRAVIADIVAQHPDIKFTTLYHEKNRGRGRTVTDGLSVAKGRFMGFLDIDLEVRPHYIPPVLLELEKGADFALTARVFELTYHGLTRFILSKGYIRFSNKVLGTKGIDSEVGFKFFNRATMMNVITTVEDDHWFWDTELVYRARRAGKKIVEVPALFTRSRDKQTTVRVVWDTWYYIQTLFAFRRRMRKEEAEAAKAAAAKTS